MPLAPGEVIRDGKYRIADLIGEGGMARVWLAEELTCDGRQVAIKQPRSDLPPDEAQRLQARYQREIRVCTTLEEERVPNLVRPITTEPYEGGILLVLEYMPGGDLAALLRSNPTGLPVEKAVEIALAILGALDGSHSHERRFLHRDVKPSNVLFDSKSRAHLGDFGLARGAEDGQSLTRALGGEVLLTPDYAAPEQLAGSETLTPSADLYSLGCVLFEMLTGRRYRETQPGTRARSLRPSVPAAIDEVLAKALAEDPWRRWQSASDMAAALERAWRESAGVSSAQTGRGGLAPGQVLRSLQQGLASRRQSWAIGVVAVAVVLVALGAPSLAASYQGAQATATAAAGTRTADLVLATGTALAMAQETVAAVATGTGVARATATGWAIATGTAIAVSTVGEQWRGTQTAALRGTEVARADATRTVVAGRVATAVAIGRIGYVSGRDGNPEVYVASLDHSYLAHLTAGPGDDWDPAFSPDGSLVAFASNRGGTYAIYRASAEDGSNVRRLTSGTASDARPSWSPDGRRIAFDSDRSGNRAIYVMGFDDSVLTRLTNDPADDVSPAWSPDGTRIAFAGKRDGNWEIYAMNADGSGVTRLTRNPAQDSSPDWSPDGSRIAFESNRDGRFEIYVMNADGSGQTRLTHGPGDATEPAWSPDGKRIAFTSNRDGNSEVYVMNADGSRQTRVTTEAPANASNPVWWRN